MFHGKRLYVSVCFLMVSIWFRKIIMDPYYWFNISSRVIPWSPVISSVTCRITLMFKCFSICFIMFPLCFLVNIIYYVRSAVAPAAVRRTPTSHFLWGEEMHFFVFCFVLLFCKRMSAIADRSEGYSYVFLYLFFVCLVQFFSDYSLCSFLLSAYGFQ